MRLFLSRRLPRIWNQVLQMHTVLRNVRWHHVHVHVMRERLPPVQPKMRRPVSFGHHIDQRRVPGMRQKLRRVLRDDNELHIVQCRSLLADRLLRRFMRRWIRRTQQEVRKMHVALQDVQ